MKKQRIWGMRAGRKGSAHHLFLDLGLVVLEKQLLSDLNKFKDCRSSFYDAYCKLNPDEGKASIRGIGGKFYRFVHEIQIGDLVLYPCLFDKNIYVGKVTGSYFFDKDVKSDFPHRRKIRWLCCFPKKLLSEMPKREIGAARTLFEVKKNVGEITHVIKTNSTDIKNQRTNTASAATRKGRMNRS
jgi:restriction system protein